MTTSDYYITSPPPEPPDWSRADLRAEASQQHHLAHGNTARLSLDGSLAVVQRPAGGDAPSSPLKVEQGPMTEREARQYIEANADQWTPEEL